MRWENRGVSGALPSDIDQRTGHLQAHETLKVLPEPPGVEYPQRHSACAEILQELDRGDDGGDHKAGEHEIAGGADRSRIVLFEAIYRVNEEEESESEEKVCGKHRWEGAFVPVPQVGEVNDAHASCEEML